jgi:hypothetical protein
LMREKYAPGLTLFVDSSFADPGALALDVDFGPLTSATPSQFSRARELQGSDANVIKQGGSAPGIRTAIRSRAIRSVMCRSSRTDGASSMVGLNTDPTTDGDWQSIDFAFYARADGIWDIRESGADPLTGTAYTTKTLFGITYDGANVRYYVDGVLVRTTGQRPDAVHGFLLPYARRRINSLDFGPTTTLAVVDTSGSAAMLRRIRSRRLRTLARSQAPAAAGTTNVDLATVTFTPTDAASSS